MGHSTLSDHLHSQDLGKRTLAAEFLSRSSAPAIIKELLGSLNSRNRYVATRAAWGLSLMSPELALPYLAKALVSSETTVIERAAWALGRVDDPRARRILIEGLAHPRAEVRQGAAGGLWRAACGGYRSEEAIESLRNIVGRDNGIAAIVLGYMLRPEPLPVEAKTPAQDSVFALAGGEWIR